MTCESRQFGRSISRFCFFLLQGRARGLTGGGGGGGGRSHVALHRLRMSKLGARQVRDAVGARGADPRPRFRSLYKD